MEQRTLKAPLKAQFTGRCFVASTLCPGSHRQSEPETTALAHLTLDPHLATVSLDQVPGDGQPQARAAS